MVVPFVIVVLVIFPIFVNGIRKGDLARNAVLINITEVLVLQAVWKGSAFALCN